MALYVVHFTIHPSSIQKIPFSRYKSPLVGKAGQTVTTAVSERMGSTDRREKKENFSLSICE
jgi:hypothetical protein